MTILRAAAPALLSGEGPKVRGTLTGKRNRARVELGGAEQNATPRVHRGARRGEGAAIQL